MNIRSAQGIHERIRNENGDTMPELVQIEQLLTEAREKMPEATKHLQNYLRQVENPNPEVIPDRQSAAPTPRIERMRQQLYGEISKNYHNTVVRIALCTSIAGIGECAPMHFTKKLDISFNIWNFYNDPQNRELLFELDEAEAIVRIYDKFSRIGTEDQPGYAHVRAKEAAAEVDDRLFI